MKSLIELKIEETYQVALKLGLDKSSDIEKRIFKKMLQDIVVAAIDDVRHGVNELLHEQSRSHSDKE